MKKMSSRTSVRYTSALASKRPGARTCHPSSYVVATTGFKAGSGPRANGSGQAARGSAHASSTMAGARNPRLTDANTSCPPPPFQVSPARGGSRRELHRPAAHARRVLLPRVFSHEVRVELLARERAPERIQGELRVAEQALRVQDDEVGLRGEVVASGEVAARIHRRHALGKAAGLEDLVIRPRIAERGVPRAGQEPELREQGADPAARVLAPAALPLVARAPGAAAHPTAGPAPALPSHAAL